MASKFFDEMRDKIKEGLAECTPGQRTVFCRMYAPKEYHKPGANRFIYNYEKLAEHNIDSVVDGMPNHKLEWALQQITHTLEKSL